MAAFSYNVYLESFIKDKDGKQPLKKILITPTNIRYSSYYRSVDVIEFEVPKSNFKNKSKTAQFGEYDYLPSKNDNIRVYSAVERRNNSAVEIFFKAFYLIATPEVDTTSGFITLTCKDIEATFLATATRGNRRFVTYIGQGVRGMNQVLPLLFNSVFLKNNANVQYIDKNLEKTQITDSIRDGRSTSNVLYDSLLAKQMFMFSEVGEDENSKELVLNLFMNTKANSKNNDNPPYKINTSIRSVKALSIIKRTQVNEQIPMSYTYNLSMRVGKGKGENSKYNIRTKTYYNFGGTLGIYVDEKLPLSNSTLLGGEENYLEIKKKFATATSKAQVKDEVEKIRARMEAYIKYRIWRDLIGSVYLDINLQTGIAVEEQYLNIAGLQDLSSDRSKAIQFWKRGERVLLDIKEENINNLTCIITSINWDYNSTNTNITLTLTPVIDNFADDKNEEADLTVLELVKRAKASFKKEMMQTLKVGETMPVNDEDLPYSTNDVFKEFAKDPLIYKKQLQFLNPFYNPDKDTKGDSLKAQFPFLVNKQ